MGEYTDKGGHVRKGEELSLDTLLPWLRRQIPSATDKPQVTQFAGGASNWTYRLKFDQEDLILRRGPVGTRAKGAHDMGREYRLQSALQPVFPYVPHMRCYSDDPEVIGAEFYVMDRIEGIIPRRNLPRGMTLTVDQTKGLCATFLNTLIDLHKVEYKAAGLAELAAGEGYVRRQIEGWSKRYRNARTWNVPNGERIMRWLADNMPETEYLSLTHNDFRLDNVVLDQNDPTKIIGVLDWELATIGDRYMDLGNLLAYWIEPGEGRFAQKTRMQPSTLPGMMTKAEIVDYYCAAIGHRPKSMAFYEVYGLFRLSAIIQQIYYRYHHKQTQNPRFKTFWMLTWFLQRRALARIKMGG